MVYKYKNITILNKTSITKGQLHKIIDFTRPDKIKHTAFNLLIIYADNYRKELRKLNLEKPYKLFQIYPFTGCVTSNYKKANKRWVSRPIVIVTVDRKFYPMIYHGIKNRGYLPTIVDTRAEGLIRIMAHEFNHIAFGEHPRALKLYGEKQYDKFCESDCDRYTIERLLDWRMSFIKELKKGNREMLWTFLKSGFSDMVEATRYIWRKK